MSSETSKIDTRKNAEIKNDESLQIEEEHERRLNHDELVKLTRSAIANVIESDPLLSSNLPVDPTADEIRAQKEVVQGQAITLYLDRGLLPKLAVVVPIKTTTILDLKKSIIRTTNLALKREKVDKKISWKYVWKKYWLTFEGLKLINDMENIEDYGITNKAVLKYVKKRREKKKIKTGL